jgi:hypothetical protein
MEVVGFWISDVELLGYVASWLTTIRKEGPYKMTFFSHE